MRYSKIISFLGIACVVTLLLIFGVRLQAQNESKDKITIAKVNEMRAQAMQRGSQFRNRQQGTTNWGAQGRQQGSNWGHKVVNRVHDQESRDVRKIQDLKTSQIFTV